MRVAILLIMVLSVGAAVSSVSSVSYSRVVHEEWTAFKLVHNKQYTETEDLVRKKIYTQNRYKIAKHNQKYERGEASYTLAMNKYGDLAHHEFLQIVSGYKRTNKFIPPKPAAHFVKPANVAIPAHMDWREAGAVTAVKDQETCRACWAFSATGALESHYFRQTSKLVTLSEQNLIDCSETWGNAGCEGGNMMFAYSYVDDNDGIDNEDSYPYESLDRPCVYNSSNAAASDVGFVYVTGHDEQTLMEAVATMGPVSVGLDATLDTFHLYGSGIYYEPRCSSANLNHAMLVVGYGARAETGEQYWILKNSMGTSWGADGYMWLARGRGDQCGVASEATYPLV